MSSLISIPREALAELLRASGSSLTPEQYVASLPANTTYKKYPGRAKVAAWSKNILVVIAVFAALILPFSFDLENVIIVAGLATVTFFEFRVYAYFSEGNPAAPGLGFRNQSIFAAAILIYGLYHASFPSQLELPSEYREVMDPSTTGLVQAMERFFYLLIGIVGGVSQFALAWYYRAAQVRTTA